MIPNSDAARAADAEGRLACLRRLDLAPEQVEARVAALRPAVEAGEGAAMREAIRQARIWWDAYPVAQDIMGVDQDDPDHLTDGWSDLFELVARAPARCLDGMLAKAELAAWCFADSGSDMSWRAELGRTIYAGLVDVKAGGASQGGAGHE